MSLNYNLRIFNEFVNNKQQEKTDVNFIFESSGVNTDKDMAGPPEAKIARRSVGDNDDDGSVIRISAHKKVLAESSPVFNAMFNGELKETGDVKMADASPDAFLEFLWIFYDENSNLSLENLDEIMKLIDKYDVKDDWPIVDEFFCGSLAVDDILWGLHLAVKFRRDNLITHCTNMIEKNSAKVCDMIEIDDNGKPKLRSNPNNRPMTDADLANIFSRIYTVIKKFVSESVDARLTGVISLKLEVGERRTIDQIQQSISFSSNCTLLLTHVTFAGIHLYSGCCLPYDINVKIAEIETNHKMSPGRGTIKFINPVVIQANHLYTIQTKINTKFFPLPYIYVHKTPVEPVQVDLKIQITFDKANSSSNVSAMNFYRYDH